MGNGTYFIKILNFLDASHGGGCYVLHLFLERSLVAGYQDVIEKRKRNEKCRDVNQLCQRIVSGCQQKHFSAVVKINPNIFKVHLHLHTKAIMIFQKFPMKFLKNHK